jgi:capsular polysaccharide export protein
MSPLPFLRSPPFPDVAAATTAISAPAVGGAEVEAVTDAVLAAIVDARVGGTFWGEQPRPVAVLIGAGILLEADGLEGTDAKDIGLMPGALSNRSGTRDIPGKSDPWHLVSQCREVHADPDDEVALIAGLLDVPVFGPDGALVAPDRLRKGMCRRIAAACYRDCFTGEPVDVAQALSILADWRRHIDRNRGIVAASGMAFWKRKAIGQFLWDGNRSPPMMSPEPGLRRAAKEVGALAVWPSRIPADLPDEAARAGVPLARVEDGFIRSRGLGAGLHPPGSVVIDRSGIYYDGGRASDLESLLATHPFPEPITDRARRLRTRLCATGVTKYGASGSSMIDLPAGRRTILAVGQVDDDLSVKLGGAGVSGNLDFLKRVRRAEPDAWIIYRPHPDVQAGHRKGHLSDSSVLAHADTIDTGAPLMELVKAVDDVHVLSSLTGFEALMRGCAVTVHGMPFYAGWGLTRDLAPVPARRGRRLSLDQLVAGALILYPSYLDPVTNLPCGPELMVDRLADGFTPPATSLIRLRALQGKLRRFMTLSAEFLHG